MRMTRVKLRAILVDKQGYLRWSDKRIARQFKISIKMASEVKKEVKSAISISKNY